MTDLGAPQSAAASACDQRYFGALAEGRFEIPRVCCPHCGSQDLEWAAPSGNGTVYTVTIVRRAEGDYTVVLVDLEEGPRLMSRVVDMPVEQVRIGLPVRARIDAMADGPLLVFAARGEVRA